MLHITFVSGTIQDTQVAKCRVVGASDDDWRLEGGFTVERPSPCFVCAYLYRHPLSVSG
jgi:hypothetical protein